jgi:Glycosyltransferase WbsX/Methyltransferase domain
MNDLFISGPQDPRSGHQVHSALEAILAPELAPLLWRPHLLGVESAWWKHVPFAFWLTNAARPKTLVELGTHNGVSYAAFCEAVVRSTLSTHCYAVGTWVGDAQTGQGDDSIFNRAKDFNDKHFSGFSELIRAKFNDAVVFFENGSIDILHVDGSHTYEAVKNDFETWLPKLSDKAVVLFHGTNVKQGDFGVWRFWAEISMRYRCFEFLHGQGLGVLVVGSQASSPVLELCALSEESQIATARERFKFAGMRWFVEWRGQAEGERLSKLLQHNSEKTLHLKNNADILSRQLAVSENTIAQIRRSTSWRITIPLRAAGRAAKQIRHAAQLIRNGRLTFNRSDGLSSNQILESPPYAISTRRIIEEGSFPVKTIKVSHAALSKHREAPVSNDQGILKDPTKLIAFYLPQYHRISENSLWWGPGFTEWTNVAKGRPNFSEHYQPHIPGQLGFYDLSHLDVVREQVELAKRYGIFGFCFYYYWFSGRRILERPVDNFLASDIEFPFCLCWANENWTRTWDGDSQGILLAQGYAEGDEARFIDTLVPFFRDRRYIKVDGRPMLLAYRAMEFPDPVATIAKWREAARKYGLPGLHVVVVDFYDLSDPRDVGADAMVEFPPHKFNGAENQPDTFPRVIDPNFSGNILDYTKIVMQAASRQPPDFPYYRGIIPGWDNTARRQNTPTTIINNSPSLYESWMRYLRTYNRLSERDSDSTFIFVNAWNEWGEGCHLEPDLRFGLEFLEATARSSWYDAKDTPTTLEEAQSLLTAEVRDWQESLGKPLDASTRSGSLTRVIHNALRPMPKFHRGARNLRHTFNALMRRQ